MIPSRLTALALASLSGVGLSGCVHRTLQITSDPSGALVWLNDREVGRTPIEVEFLHYGTYDVRLVRDGFEPMLTYGEAKAPIWDNVPLDFVAEVLPTELESHVEWHYVLEPRNDDPTALIDRAAQMRAGLPPAVEADVEGDGEPPTGE